MRKRKKSLELFVTLIKWAKKIFWGNLKLETQKNDDKEDHRMAEKSVNEQHHRRFDESELIGQSGNWRKKQLKILTRNT
jgi:hypothetical protein